MKSAIILITLLFANIAFSASANTFTCSVFKEILTPYSCTVCESRNGDNDCVKERETTCLEARSYSTKVSASDSADKESFTLSDSNDGIKMMISQNKYGYSAILRAEALAVDTAIQSTKTINPKIDSIELSAKTNQKLNTAGSVSKLTLRCIAQ